MKGDVRTENKRLLEIIKEGEEDGYTNIKLATPRGKIDTRYYAAGGAVAGVIWVGGVGGDWDTPANDLYPDLSEKLLKNNIVSLRVKYRNSHVLEEATYDALAGIEFLIGQGISSLALGGWSFGGAVAIRAAALSKAARTVITYATQSYGADIASKLPKHCSLLLLHGSNDETLSPYNSHLIYGIAHEPKKIIIFEGDNHGLGKSSKEVKQITMDWLLSELKWK